MAENTQVRQGAEVNKSQGDNLAAKQAAGSEITSNGVFTKVVKDGKAMVIPTSEIYEKEPDERIDGVEVQDGTTPGARGRTVGAQLQDKLEREFNTQKRGDSVSKHHAQGAAGSIARHGDVPEVDREEGAYEDEEEERRSHAEGATTVTETGRGGAKEGQEGTQEADGGFDAGDPEATTLADLPQALEGLSDSEVKKAQKKDTRSGAKSIYKQRLSGE